VDLFWFLAGLRDPERGDDREYYFQRRGVAAASIKPWWQHDWYWYRLMTRFVPSY